MKKSIKIQWLACCLVFGLAHANPALSADNRLSEAEQAEGWQLLFNGQDLSQWRNFEQAELNNKWQVANGEFSLTEGGGGDILTKQAYGNFELQLDWKIALGGNSGILLLADENGKYIYSHAPEIQILDDARHPDNKLPSHRSGSLYDMIASPASSQKPAGEWNHVRIVLNNQHLQVWQNNVLTADIVIGSEPWQTLLAASKFKDWPGFAANKSGHIGLQDHGDQVSFKNVKIKQL